MTTLTKNETRRMGRIAVRASNIIGTDCWVFSAWEPGDGHGTQTHLGDESMGEIASRPLPQHIDAIPAGPARIAASREWRRQNEAVAYMAIRHLFDESVLGVERMGEIEIYTNTRQMECIRS